MMGIKKEEQKERMTFLRQLFLRVIKAKTNAEEVIVSRINAIWALVNEQEEAGERDAEGVRDFISETFVEIRNRFSEEDIEKTHAWARLSKIAIRCTSNPVNELVRYVDENNYIKFSKRLSDLVKSAYKDGEETEIKNAEAYAKAIYTHILESINPRDVPACLALGKMALHRGEYEVARAWFRRVINTKDPFSGVTSLLGSYEKEVKDILLQRDHEQRDSLKNRLLAVNRKQLEIYEEWAHKIEESIQTDEDNQLYKSQYVTLMTRFARFEKHRGNFTKSLKLLDSIPDSYPEVYRKHAERGFLFHCRPNKNKLYNLEKSIDAFRTAESFMENEAQESLTKKGRKSVLMPLANTLFTAGQYLEADNTCDRVLKIDKKEQRAIILKERIASMVA